MQEPSSGARPSAFEDAAERLLSILVGGAGEPCPLTHVERIPGRAGERGDWPVWVPSDIRDRLATFGIEAPWRHQVEAAALAWDGHDVVVATGTASGKSLAYQLPGFSALVADDRARVLYLSPTKALAGDQLRSLRAIAPPGVRPCTYDGDTPPDERDWVRAHGNWVLSNPDMLHHGILPQHARWASFLRRLRFVVVDECHGYRGLFGAHVAHVLRRLRRICTLYGARPVFILASATVSDPGVSASRLVGRPIRVVTEDSSPRAPRVFALWEPSSTSLRGENDVPLRRAAGSETARILADLVAAGARTLAFIRSRRGAEIVALSARRLLVEAGAPDLADRVAAYRAGYLPEERRALERAFSDGELLGVAATNALELGIDIAGLDAIVLAGYPGTLASVWQQSGRAGRAGTSALTVFVARDDPLDTYLVHHPRSLFGRPVECSVFDPENPHVLAPQLCCAASERPILDSELADFGGPGTVREVLDALVGQNLLRRRPQGWYWTSADRPRADLRGSGGETVTIVEGATGNLLGTIDPSAAHSTVHEGAVYLHQGESYVVDVLDLHRRVALVHQDAPDWTTDARQHADIRIIRALQSRVMGSVSVHFGDVEVSHQVIGYQRRRISSAEIIDETPLDLPPRRLETRAIWYTVTADAVAVAGIAAGELDGATHAAEHAAIGLLPLFATCDRWDIGGVSTALHCDTGRPTVFVYDGYPGGAGFAERGHGVLGQWLGATRDAIDACGCRAGCPSCIQSPKCGSGNDPLDKGGAIRLLDIVLDALLRRAG